jgi:uncharacterized sulfatase
MIGWTACDASVGQDIKSPNILWIVAEDLSQDLGCYGNHLVKTPVIDSLARNGVKLTNLFTTSPVCAPSRTALATGVYQTSLGAFHMRYPDSLKPALPAHVLTLPQILKAHGYLTANIKDAPGTGKLDWLFQYDEKEHFDVQHWHEISKSQKPFFAQVSVSQTHRPFPKSDPDTFLLSQIQIPPYYPNHQVTRKDFAGYYQSIEELDQNVKSILDSLRHYQLTENTIIFFFSDHGQPMTRAKMFLYDSGLKVPCIISYPQKHHAFDVYTRGETDQRLLSALDLVATTIDLAGIDLPEYIQGRNFLLDKSKEIRSSVFAAADRIGESNLKSRAIRTKDFKYIRNINHDLSIIQAATAYRQAMHPIHQLMKILDQKNELNPVQRKLFETQLPEELYDLTMDPFEIINLASNPEYKSKLQEMRLAMNEKLQEIDDKGLLHDRPEIVDAFEAYRKQSAQLYLKREKALYEEVLKSMEEKN